MMERNKKMLLGFTTETITAGTINKYFMRFCIFCLPEISHLIRFFASVKNNQSKNEKTYQMTASRILSWFKMKLCNSYRC
jgi:hypothetical protein